MAKRLIIFFIIFFNIISCTTIKIKDKETYSKVLYKNLIKKSSKISAAKISGIFKISGIEDIPSIFMEFRLNCSFNEKIVSFRMRALNKNLIDIFINKNDVYIINNISPPSSRTPSICRSTRRARERCASSSPPCARRARPISTSNG